MLHSWWSGSLPDSGGGVMWSPCQVWGKRGDTECPKWLFPMPVQALSEQNLQYKPNLQEQQFCFFGAFDGMEKTFSVFVRAKKKKKNRFRGYSMWVPLCVCGCWPAGPFAHASVSALMKRKTRAQMDVGGEDFATDECICNGEAVTMMKWVKTRSWRYGCNLDKLVTEEVKIISEFELTSLIWPF